MFRKEAEDYKHFSHLLATSCFIHLFQGQLNQLIHLILFLYLGTYLWDQDELLRIEFIVQDCKCEVMKFQPHRLFIQLFFQLQTTRVQLQMFVRRLIRNVTVIRPNQYKFTLNKDKGKQDKSQSFYNLLKIPTNATAEQIKSSYQNLVKSYQQDAKQANQELMKKIRQAYAILSNPGERQKYDSQRGYTKQGTNQRYQSQQHQNIMKQKAKPYTPRFQDISTAKGNSPFFSSPMINFAAVAGILALLYYYFNPRIEKTQAKPPTNVPVKTNINPHVTASQQVRKSEMNDKAQKSVLGGDRDQKLR